MTNPESQFPDTRASLLVQLGSGYDEAAWREFVTIYRPVIYRIARGRGLQDADAQDLAQKVLISVSGAIDSWEPRENGPRFRHWLRKVAKNAILNVLTRQPMDQGVGGSEVQGLLNDQPETSEWLERELELERQREVYLRAAAIVRAEVTEDSWLVFQLAVVEQMPIEDVARQVGKSVGAAYAARGRVMNRLQQAVILMNEGQE